MDPITQAIVAAVGTNLDDEEKAFLVNDKKKEALVAYKTLKERIANRYTPESELLEAILLLEGKDTEANRARVAAEVAAVQAAGNPRLVEAAHVLLEEVKALS